MMKILGSVAIILSTSLFLYIRSKPQAWRTRLIFKIIHSLLTFKFYLFPVKQATSPLYSLPENASNQENGKSYMMTKMSPGAEAFEAILQSGKNVEREMSVKSARVSCDVAFWEPLYPPKELAKKLHKFAFAYTKSKEEKSRAVSMVHVGNGVEYLTKKKDLNVLLFLHGGGYVAGSADCYASFLYKLHAGTNCEIYGVNYGLCPESTLAEGLEDCAQSLLYLFKLIMNANMPTEPSVRFIILGDSAGGGQVLGLLQLLTERATTEKAASYIWGDIASKVVCAVMISPWADLSLGGRSYKDNVHIDGMITVGHLALTQIAGNTKTGYIFGRFDFQNMCSKEKSGASHLPLRIMICSSKRELLYSDAETIAARIKEETEKSKKNRTVEVYLEGAEFGPHIYPILGDFAVEYQQALQEIIRFVVRSL